MAPENCSQTLVKIKPASAETIPGVAKNGTRNSACEVKEIWRGQKRRFTLGKVQKYLFERKKACRTEHKARVATRQSTKPKEKKGCF